MSNLWGERPRPQERAPVKDPVDFITFGTVFRRLFPKPESLAENQWSPNFPAPTAKPPASSLSEVQIDGKTIIDVQVFDRSDGIGGPRQNRIEAFIGGITPILPPISERQLEEARSIDAAKAQE